MAVVGAASKGDDCRGWKQKSGRVRKMMPSVSVIASASVWADECPVGRVKLVGGLQMTKARRWL